MRIALEEGGSIAGVPDGILHSFAEPKPGVLDAVAELRAIGVKIGSTTG